MVRRKREDDAEGCRALAQDDQVRAAGADSEHMRHVLERSAEAWTSRAKLLDRLERKFSAWSQSLAVKRERRGGRKAARKGIEAISGRALKNEDQGTREGQCVEPLPQGQ